MNPFSRFKKLRRRSQQPLPKYAVTVEHAGQIREVVMDTRSAARAAHRFKARSDLTIEYEFAPGSHGYLVQHGNPTKFTKPHPVSALPAGKTGMARLHVRCKDSVFPNGTRLYIQFHDDRQRLATYALTLRGPSQTMSFRPPRGARTASIALRLTGAGILRPLAISYRVVVEALPAAASPIPASAVEISDFDRMVLTAAGTDSYIAGIYAFPASRYSERRLQIRTDQAVPVTGAFPVCGLIFDDTIPPPFGWDGTFDTNFIANMALMRILAQLERANLPTVLVYDECSEVKPFFADISPLFAHQVRKGPRTEANVAQILQLE